MPTGQRSGRGRVEAPAMKTAGPPTSGAQALWTRERALRTTYYWSMGRLTAARSGQAWRPGRPGSRIAGVACTRAYALIGIFTRNLLRTDRPGVISNSASSFISGARRIGAPTAFVGSGIDRAQIGQLWVRRSTCGEVVCCRAGPGRLRGSKNRPKTRRRSTAKATTSTPRTAGRPNKILELQAC